MKLSVIVPAYNEEKYLAETLEHIRAELDGLPDAEVIVVDNGSTDATRRATSLSLSMPTRTYRRACLKRSSSQ